MKREQIAVMVNGAGTVRIAATDASGVVMSLPDRKVARGVVAADGRVVVPVPEWRRTQFERFVGHAIWGVLGFGAGAACMVFLAK